MSRITIDLDRQDIEVGDFTEAFAAQVRLVRQIMVEMGVPAHEVRWVITDLKHGSALASAEPRAIGQHAYMSDVDAAIAAAGAGIRQLAETATRPKFFSDEALRTSRRLIHLVASHSAGKASLGFGLDKVTPSLVAAEHIDTLVRSEVASIGSIEGRLVQVSGQDGSYTIAVQDRLRGRKVKCSLPEHLLKGALLAFESRVIIRGIIWSKSDGAAVRIDVRDFERIPSDEELPTMEQVRGLLHGYRRADGE